MSGTLILQIISGAALLLIIAALVFNRNFRTDILAQDGEASLGGFLKVKGALILALIALFVGLLIYSLSFGDKMEARIPVPPDFSEVENLLIINPESGNFQQATFNKDSEQFEITDLNDKSLNLIYKLLQQDDEYQIVLKEKPDVRYGQIKRSDLTEGGFFTQTKLDKTFDLSYNVKLGRNILEPQKVFDRSTQAGLPFEFSLEGMADDIYYLIYQKEPRQKIGDPCHFDSRKREPRLFSIRDTLYYVELTAANFEVPQPFAHFKIVRLLNELDF